jgi:predicted  nucleic acid-binding Zn-ribbon protein
VVFLCFLQRREEQARLDALAAIPTVESQGTQSDPDMEVSGLKERVLNLQEALKTSQEAAEYVREELNNVNYQIDEVQTQLEESREAHNATVNELKHLKQTEVGLEDKIKLLTLKLQAANFEIERVNKDSGELRSDNDQLRNDIKQFETDMNEFTSKCREQQQEIEANNLSLNQLRALNIDFADTVTKVTAERDALEAKLDYFKTVECSCGNLFPISIPQPSNPSCYDLEIGPLELEFGDSPDDTSCVEGMEGVTVGVRGVRTLRAQGSAASADGSPDIDMPRRGVGEEGFGLK